MSSLLYIDSDPIDLLDQISHLLRPTTVDIAVARTGSEALRLAEKDPPDVVLLDVSMPDMPGLEICKRILKLDPRIPVILITATATAETALEAVRQGAYDYLFKPVDLGHLQKMLVEAIEASRRMRQTALPGRFNGSDGFRFESYIKDRLNSGTSDLYSEAHLQLDRILLPATLRWVNGNQLHAARILGIARQTLRNRLRELGLSITKSVDGEGTLHRQIGDEATLRRGHDGRGNGQDETLHDQRSMDSYH